MLRRTRIQIHEKNEIQHMAEISTIESSTSQLLTDLREIIEGDEEGTVLSEKSRCFKVEELIALSCNFDQCKFPKDSEEIHSPADLLADYHKRREALDAQIDRTLSQIHQLLGL